MPSMAVVIAVITIIVVVIAAVVVIVIMTRKNNNNNRNQNNNRNNTNDSSVSSSTAKIGASGVEMQSLVVSGLACAAAGVLEGVWGFEVQEAKKTLNPKL